MWNSLSGRGSGAREGAAQSFDSLKELVSKQLQGIDLEDLRRRGSGYAVVARQNVQQRVRPQPKPNRFLPVAGLLVAGAAIAGVAVLLYDKSRRDALQGHVDRFTSGAKSRYADLGGGVRNRLGWAEPLDEADLERRVREVVAEGGQAVNGLKVTVEGRTVYLRGAVEDAGAVDQAAERIHGVDGVVAVVNLTTSPAPASARPNGGSQ